MDLRDSESKDYSNLRSLLGQDREYVNGSPVFLFSDIFHQTRSHFGSTVNEKETNLGGNRG